jgi:protein involved in polysaccharide export with SLBB domain
MATDRITHFVRALILLLLLSGCATAPPIESSPLPSPTESAKVLADRPLAIGDVVVVDYFPSSHLESTPYTVGAGDILRIDVLNHPDLSRERVLVLPDGHISVPLIVRHAAAGKSVDQLARELGELYRKYKILNPVITVSVEQADARLEGLMRSISRSGRSEPLVITVDESGYLDLAFIGQVSTAQPFNELRQQIISRYRDQFGGRLAVTVNLRSRQPPIVYVIGEVVNPGSVNYTYPFTPMMAVAAAGGFKVTAENTDVRVYRYRPDRGIDQWSLDLRTSLLEGKSTTPLQISPRDVIFVPKTGVALANEAVEHYIRKMLPFDVGIGASYILNPGGIR